MKQHVRSLILAAALAAIALTVAITTATGSSGVKPTRPAAVVRRPVSRRLSHLLGRIARATRASATSHPLPAAVLEGTVQQVGITPSAAVFAGGRYPTWIIPGATEVCLMHDALGPDGSAGGICGTIVSFEQNGLAEVTESSPGSAVVLGLVPGEHASVVVMDADGSKRTVAVANNVYEITSGDPVSVTFADAAGATVTRRLPVLPAPPPPSAPPS